MVQFSESLGFLCGHFYTTMKLGMSLTAIPAFTLKRIKTSHNAFVSSSLQLITIDFAIGRMQQE